MKKILIFENPKTFNVRRSLLFLIANINHMLDIKIIKGRSFRIKLGTNILVKINGMKRLASKFLKNSISSNKFKINPKQ